VLNEKFFEKITIFSPQLLAYVRVRRAAVYFHQNTINLNKYACNLTIADNSFILKQTINRTE
jgi:hypothetical protein